MCILSSTEHQLDKTLSTTNNLTDKPNNITDIYSARIIFIEGSENTGKNSIDKINPSSNIDFYDNLNNNNNSDSLSPSEDSDTVRIYNLNKQESRLLTKENITNNINNSSDDNEFIIPIKNLSNESKTIESIPNIRSNNLKFEPVSLQSESTARIVTPTSFKLLQPKRRLIEPNQIMSIDSNSAYPPGTPDKQVIEDDVIKSLPSVKALAQAFLLTTKCTSTQHAKRPKSLPLLSDFENNIKCESPTDIISVVPEGDIRITLPSSPILEISENENIDKSVSPVLTPGKLKDNIAFFENLKRN